MIPCSCSSIDYSAGLGPDSYNVIIVLSCVEIIQNNYGSRISMRFKQSISVLAIFFHHRISVTLCHLSLQPVKCQCQLQ